MKKEQGTFELNFEITNALQQKLQLINSGSRATTIEQIDKHHVYRVGRETITLGVANINTCLFANKLATFRYVTLTGGSTHPRWMLARQNGSRRVNKQRMKQARRPKSIVYLNYE